MCSEVKLFSKRLCDTMRLLSAVRLFSSALNTLQETDVVRYPPVKPRYPPGQWGDMSESSAWYLNRMSGDLLTIPHVKERLEKMAGDKSRVMWIVEPMDIRPKNVEYRQMLTKTHIVRGLPDSYNLLDNDTNSVYDGLKPTIGDIVDLELERHHKIRLEKDIHGVVYVDKDKYITHRVLGGILNSVVARLSSSADYLHRSQTDENVRVETFWYVGGFRGEGNVVKGKWSNIVTTDKKNHGMVLFQYRHKADWQIRTEQPLPQVCEKQMYGGAVY
jgi:Mitochondrial 28S ribosomal protein S30 (PDCD9)